MSVTASVTITGAQSTLRSRRKVRKAGIKPRLFSSRISIAGTGLADAAQTLRSYRAGEPNGNFNMDRTD